MQETSNQDHVDSAALPLVDNQEIIGNENEVKNAVIEKSKDVNFINNMRPELFREIKNQNVAFMKLKLFFDVEYF